jgi:hypothetical protein
MEPKLINKQIPMGYGVAILILSLNTLRFPLLSLPSPHQRWQHDVGGLIDIKHPFEIDQIRVIMKQLLEVQSSAAVICQL